MERVIDQPDTAETFENDIDMYFKLFCEEEGIEDMKAEPQSTFYAALIYINRHCFKGTDRLRMKGTFPGYSNNIQGLNNSNCNAYNYDYLNDIADYYIYMCYKYNKISTISGYCKLTGISEDAIIDWGNDARRTGLSKAGRGLLQKLRGEYETSGESRLWSNKNPVGQLAVMNRRFGWNLPGVSREVSQRQVLTADDIRAKLTEKSTQLLSSTDADSS